MIYIYIYVHIHTVDLPVLDIASSPKASSPPPGPLLWPDGTSLYECRCGTSGPSRPQHRSPSIILVADRAPGAGTSTLRGVRCGVRGWINHRFDGDGCIKAWEAFPNGEPIAHGNWCTTHSEACHSERRLAVSQEVDTSACCMGSRGPETLFEAKP